MTSLRVLDLLVIGLYFAAMVGVGWFFSRRTKTTEDYFVGNRSYPGWVAGVSLFGAQISSITFVAYPADAYKTAWLRYLLCLMLPVSVFLATRYPRCMSIWRPASVQKRGCTAPACFSSPNASGSA